MAATTVASPGGGGVNSKGITGGRCSRSGGGDGCRRYYGGLSWPAETWGAMSSKEEHGLRRLKGRGGGVAGCESHSRVTSYSVRENVERKGRLL